MSSVDLAASILARVPAPVWVVDHAGTVVFANDAAAAALGYGDPAALRGLPGHDTVHHHHPDGSEYPVADCPLLRPSRTGDPDAAEDQWLFRRDGSLFPIAWSAAPIELPDGRGTVLAFRDVARQRAHREAVRSREWDELAGHLPAVTSADARVALLDRIRAFATTHAADPSLRPERLARRHHVFLRALQALFAEHGESPASYIRQQRLAHARRLLLDGCAVAVAARNSGFADAGTFTRAFRRAFGTTPSAFVERRS